ncbi:unnamed protein product [Polarella glacialis]|uniref:Nudix hydrolase domain-containing protein n=1 Tax=Polarella glacialis TaxID=89957 RepID=A0A813IHE1_POLGL|nr:unnamed protein product [Polarella glacialis]CAE8650880.1 unnamed protein product [Polarella glacialis]
MPRQRSRSLLLGLRILALIGVAGAAGVAGGWTASAQTFGLSFQRAARLGKAGGSYPSGLRTSHGSRIVAMASASSTVGSSPKAVEASAKKPRHSAVPRTLVFLFDKHLPPQRVLLIRYSERKGAMAGMHNAVGGHVERGEDVAASARREVFEETGVKLETEELHISGILHVQDFFGADVMMFVAAARVDDSTTLSSSEEGDLKWVPLEQVNELAAQGLVFEDLPELMRATLQAGRGPAFTGRSLFNGGGKLLELVLSLPPPVT